MKGYSSEIPENCAAARLEGTNVSFKDLVQVCGVIRDKKTDWAVSFLEKVSDGEVPVFYRTYNKKIGHRRELGGRKGRYPQKAAKIVLKLLQSAMANGRMLGFGETFKIIGAAANRKEVYPRLAPKGRRVRSALTTSRIEIILKGSPVPKGVSVTPPKKEEKKAEEKKEEPKAPTNILKEEAKQHEHKHEAEKLLEHEKARPTAPHQHGEHDKR